jgi:type II secretory pathway pseudopilin PulG
MTLLELIVGLTVTGVTVSAGYAAFTSIVDHRSRTQEQVEAIGRAAEARRTLAGWLENARLQIDRDGPQFRGLDGVYQGLPDDELSFLTTASDPLGAGETVVRLFIDRDTLTPERGFTAELSRPRANEVERVEIEPAVGGLDFRYSTNALGQTEWLPSWISSTVLPLGVELRLAAQPGDSLHPLLRLPLVLPIGTGR